MRGLEERSVLRDEAKSASSLEEEESGEGGVERKKERERNGREPGEKELTCSSG